MMIKRSSILKLLNEHGSYEKKFFTKKKAQLEEIAKNLGIDLTQPPSDEPVKPVKIVKKIPVQIQEFSDSSGGESESEQEEEPKPKKPKAKKITRSRLKPKDDSNEYKPNERQVQKDRSDSINTLIKNFAQDIRSILREYDVEYLDELDLRYVEDYYNEKYDEVLDKIETLLSQGEFSDSDVSKIEKKMNVQKIKMETFLK